MKAKAKKSGKRAAGVTEGSGNVFRDLGISNPERGLLQAKLTLQIYTILKGSRMTRVQIVKNLGVRQFQASLLMRNRIANFSVTELMGFLTALRRNVEIGRAGRGAR
jgi:predicted XRE-type DNA-binding protein